MRLRGAMGAEAFAIVAAFAEGRFLLQQSELPRLLITNSQSVPAHCLGIGDEVSLACLCYSLNRR